MDFVVSRKTWYRGQGAKSSKLLLYNKMRCCFGHVAQQCNIPDTLLILRATPASVFDASFNIDLRFPANFFANREQGARHIGNASWVQVAMNMNDADTITDQQRELGLSALFAANDHKLTFTD